MVVGVTHVNGDGKIYYFNVPQSIQSKMQYGRKVLCSTRFGKQICKVKEILDGKTIEKLNIKPTQNVVAYFNKFFLEEISIPEYMKCSIPVLGKVIEKLNAFYDGNCGVVLVNMNGELVDGYITYQIYRMFYEEYINVFVLAREFTSCSS